LPAVALAKAGCLNVRFTATVGKPKIHRKFGLFSFAPVGARAIESTTA
jgi:hypothetical protein